MKTYCWELFPSTNPWKLKRSSESLRAFCLRGSTDAILRIFVEVPAVVSGLQGEVLGKHLGDFGLANFMMFGLIQHDLTCVCCRTTVLVYLLKPRYQYYVVTFSCFLSHGAVVVTGKLTQGFQFSKVMSYHSEYYGTHILLLKQTSMSVGYFCVTW